MEATRIPRMIQQNQHHEEEDEEEDEEDQAMPQVDAENEESNLNLADVPTYRIPEIMKENAEKGKNFFYGFLKSDPRAGFSSQAAPAPPPQEDEQMAEPDS
ncbi:hypothetical protein PIB30_046574 [Stylosanthes scabra]|uniref:Uncharacterized protein n=1 Tax=Stylosanthes scabra TaxID=79078 RepID=A0ABU6XE76_9FABA|nr:hypothetical protein [Stylosanthes scabra]